MKKKKIEALISWIIILIFAFYSITPLFLLFLNAFKTRGEIFSNPFKLPEKFTFTNFVKAWKNADLGAGLFNSFILASLSAILVVVIGGTAAYALSKKAKFSSNIMLFLLFCTTIPLFIILMPLFSWFKQINLDNIFGVIIITVGLSLPFSIMLLRSFLIAIPPELEEAALIDGANQWQIFWKIIVPVSRSGFITVGLINFLGGWNAFTIPLTFLGNPNQQTIIIKLYTLSGQYTAPWGQIFAGIVITILPVLILFLSLQKYFVKGLIGGSFK